jgi:predicted acetyltransferase
VSLRLRPPRVDDEAEFDAAQRELAADDFEFAFRRPGDTFSEYVQATIDHSHGRNLPAGLVAATFLVADVDGEIVGRASIRHELNEFLRAEGGHVGYGVRPAHRRRGYATEILRQSLIIARALGVDRVLVTCDDTNVGSIGVIEACGGVLEDVVPASGTRGGRTTSLARPGTRPAHTAIRRYWID